MKRTGTHIMRRQRSGGGYRLLAALGLCLLVAPAARAAFEDDTSGARMRGLAGASVAVADDSEAVFSQPAGLATLSGLNLSCAYGRLFTGLNDNSGIGDSVVTIGRPLGNGFGAGLAYKSIALDAVYREQAVVAAIGCRLHRSIAVGVNAKYLGIHYGSDAYTRIDPVFSMQQDKNAMDADAGILITLPMSLTFSYVRQNLLGADLGIAEEARLTARDRAGLAYRETSFLVAAEYMQDDGRQRFLAGMEKTLAHDILTVRLGAGWGTQEFRKITTGFRVSIGQFSMDYAFDFPLGIEHTSGTHYLALVFRAQPRREATAQARTETKVVPRMLPGMLPEQVPPAPATAAPVAAPAIATATIVAAVEPELPALPEMRPVPELLPASTGALRTPLNALLDFDTAIASTTCRMCYAAEISTNIVIETPPPPPPAVKPVAKKRVAEAAPEANKAGVAPSAQQGAVLPALFHGTMQARTHRVSAGETLPALAEHYYGSRSAWYIIYEANTDRIEKGVLEPGQVLIIPQN